MELLVSFIISYVAGLINPLIESLSEYDLDDKINDSFSVALWNWRKKDPGNRDNSAIASYKDIIPFISKPYWSIDAPIQELLDLWKLEMFKDPILKATLDDYQHTRLQQDVSQIKEAVINNKNFAATFMTFQQKKDIDTLTELMEAFSFHLLDDFCKTDPTYIDMDVVGCYDCWTAKMNASTFKIYDDGLRRAIENFYSVWKEAIVLGENWYSPAYGTGRFKFYGLQGDRFISPEAEKTFGKFFRLRLDLQPLLKKLADYIQDNYEIDLDACAMKYLNNSYRLKEVV